MITTWKWRGGKKAFLCAAALAPMLNEIAIAEEADSTSQRGQSVRERARPEYDAAGLRAGSFLVFPSINFSAATNDNIYAISSPETDDIILSTEPSMLIRSTWSRHLLTLQAGGKIERYVDTTSENNNEFYSKANAELDLRNNTQLKGSIYYGSLTESRSNNSVDDGNGALLTAEPITYELIDAEAGISHTINRIRLNASYNISSYDYNDQQLLSGGNSDQDVRDHDILEYQVQADLAISPDTSLFVRGAITKWDYDLAPPDAPFNRDSDGFEIAGGANFKLGRIANGEIFVGYQERSFDDPRFKKNEALDYGAAVYWYLSELTTVTLNAESNINPSTVDNASSFLRQSAYITVDHELLRNVLLQGRFLYGRDKFDDVARIDEWASGRARIDYLLNRKVGIFAAFDYIDQNSDVPINSFAQKSFLIGAKLQL